MLIVIHKDDSTKIQKDVSAAEAGNLAAMFPVFVVNEDGTQTPWATASSGMAPTGAGDVPAAPAAPAKKAAAKKAAAKAAPAKKKAAKKRR